MSLNALRRGLALAAAALSLLLAGAPAFAAPLTLAQVSAAAQSGDVATLRRAVNDPALAASLTEIDAETAIQLQLDIAAAFERSGAAADAIAAYRKAVDAIAAAHDGHDDLAQVPALRRIAALSQAAGDLQGAVAAIDKAEGIATAAKDPSLKEVREERQAIRAAFLAANPGAVLPPDYNPRGGEPAAYDVVEVFYATHRKPTGAAEPAKFYGGDRGPMQFGKLTVSVPRDRQVGELPRPKFWRAEFRPDPNRHMVLTSVNPSASRDAFFQEVQGRVAASGRKEVFVFIHGFNTSFDGAAVRAAQLAADLNVDGAPILYSWPSKGSMLAYAKDEEEPLVDSQIDDLANFLDDVAQRTGADRVHLIAHSMGNRFLVRALSRLAARPAPPKPRFDEVVMAAPDVGVDDFEASWPKIRATGKRFTLYASKRDKALLLSGEIHQMQRIGDARKIVVADGLQTVDTTAASAGLLGHTDFAGSALDDFRGLIWYSLAPQKRCVLQTDTEGGAAFWVFAGAGACPEGEFREAVSLARTAGSPEAALTNLQSMLADLGQAPGAAADVLLLQNVRRLLQGFAGAQ